MIGIYDLRDNLWIGNENGPLRYEERGLAQVAIQMISDQLFNSDIAYIGKLELRELPEAKKFNKRDELPVNRSGVEALRRIEGQ